MIIKKHFKKCLDEFTWSHILFVKSPIWERANAHSASYTFITEKKRVFEIPQTVNGTKTMQDCVKSTSRIQFSFALGTTMSLSRVFARRDAFLLRYVSCYITFPNERRSSYGIIRSLDASVRHRGVVPWKQSEQECVYLGSRTPLSRTVTWNCITSNRFSLVGRWVDKYARKMPS